MRHKRTTELVRPELGQVGLAHPGLLEVSGKAGIRVVGRVDGRAAEQVSDQPYWVAIYFPDLALDALEWCPGRPRVVVEERHNRREVYAACGRAQAAGILPGVPLGTALALRADLLIQVRNDQRELEYLQDLAEYCLRITPTVSLELPDVLLMEVQGSLCLFGGLGRIRQQLKFWMEDGAGVCSGRSFFAAAPTPGASAVLARSTLEHDIEETGAITSVLGGLPVSSLLQSWPGERAEKRWVKGRPLSFGKLHRQLENLGIRTIRELFRLPRDGLRRRFGSGFVEGMDKILGKHPDIRTVYRSQFHFSDSLDLEMETDNTLWIVAACEVLLGSLVAYLYQHDAMAVRVLLQLRHSGRDNTLVSLGHATGSRSRGVWMHLLNIHMEKQRLSAPVIAIGLSSEDIFPYRAHMPDLFGGAGTSWDEGSWNRTLDELRARLGDDALTGFRLRADHRPEYTCRRTNDSSFDAVRDRRIPRREGRSFFPERPGWLLSSPRRLCVSSNRNPGPPGGLNIVSRPERIESGWWDDRNVRRDYYVAIDSSHRRLWIFRDLESGSWYLHGLFA